MQQAASPPGTARPSPAAPAATGNSPATAPSATSRREACESASANVEGRERHDQMQLCLAQARIDCGRQAADQKIMGPQRQDFVRACVGGDDDRSSDGAK